MVQVTIVLKNTNNLWADSTPEWFEKTQGDMTIMNQFEPCKAHQAIMPMMNETY